MTRLPRVLSLRFAKHPRHGIALYSNVLSRSRGTRVVHLVTGTKIGRRKYRTHCSCEAKSFNPRAVCIHQQAVNRAVVRRMRNRRAA